MDRLYFIKNEIRFNKNIISKDKIINKLIICPDKLIVNNETITKDLSNVIHIELIKNDNLKDLEIKDLTKVKNIQITNNSLNTFKYSNLPELTLLNYKLLMMKK